jgi:hypothetical protein
LPNRIYAGKKKTRRGNEAVINERGQFFKHYENMLIVKTHKEVLEPWTHELTFEVPDTSFVQFIVRAESADQMNLVVTNSVGTDMPPESKYTTQNQDSFAEMKGIWKLDKGRQYRLTIMHRGDMYG